MTAFEPGVIWAADARADNDPEIDAFLWAMTSAAIDRYAADAGGVRVEGPPATVVFYDPARGYDPGIPPMLCFPMMIRTTATREDHAFPIRPFEHTAVAVGNADHMREVATYLERQDRKANQ